MECINHSPFKCLHFIGSFRNENQKISTCAQTPNDNLMLIPTIVHNNKYSDFEMSLLKYFMDQTSLKLRFEISVCKKLWAGDGQRVGEEDGMGEEEGQYYTQISMCLGEETDI